MSAFIYSVAYPSLACGLHPASLPPRGQCRASKKSKMSFICSLRGHKLINCKTCNCKHVFRLLADCTLRRSLPGGNEGQVKKSKMSFTCNLQGQKLINCKTCNCKTRPICACSLTIAAATPKQDCSFTPLICNKWLRLQGLGLQRDVRKRHTCRASRVLACARPPPAPSIVPPSPWPTTSAADTAGLPPLLLHACAFCRGPLAGSLLAFARRAARLPATLPRDRHLRARLCCRPLP